MEKDTIQQLNENWHQMKAKLDQRDAEIAKHGEETGELKEQIRQLSEAQANLETKMNRPGFEAPGVKADPDADHAKAFTGWLRRGEKGMSPESAKLLSTGDDTQAGYLAPVQMVNQLIAAVTEMSPVRTVALVIPTGQKAIEMPRRTGLPTASWAGDGQDTAASNSTYGLERIDANELVAVTDVTWSMLEDSAFNLAAFIQQDMAEQFGAAEGGAFVSGNGVKKPQGFLSAAGLIEQASGNANLLTADAITAMAMKALKTAYSQNGTFALNRNTLFTIYTLKDGQGQYLYRPNQEVGRAPTIQGRPYIECPDMPDIAAGTYPLAYGDFRRGYVIADRTQVQVLRDEMSQSSKRIVRFVGSKRTGGAVVLPEAIAKLKIAAAL